MRRCPNLSRVLLAALLIGAAGRLPTTAAPGWFDSLNNRGLNATVPDFYQHQAQVFSELGIQDTGYCFATAYLSQLYYLSARYAAPEIYSTPTAGSWLNGTVGANTAGMVGNLKSIIPIFNSPVVNFMQSYLNTLPGHLWSVTTFTNTGANFDVFNAYQASLLAEHGTVIELDPNGNIGTWWWNYHTLSGAGLDVATHSLVFTDPDNTIYPVSLEHPRDTAHGFAANDQPTGNYSLNDPFPSGGIWGQFSSTDYYQSFSVDSAGVILTGPYAGAKIVAIHQIMLVPEPATAWVFAFGAIGWIVFARARNAVVAR